MEKGQKKSEYRYYDMNKLRKQLGISKEKEEKGRALLKSGAIKVDSIAAGYYEDRDDLVAQVSGRVRRNNKDQFRAMMYFGRDEVIETICNCEDCNKNQMERKYGCAYAAALTVFMEQYMENHEVGDATDRMGSNIMTDFHKNSAGKFRTGEELIPQKCMQILPTLILDEEKRLRVSFSAGAYKLYPLKNLILFAKQVNNVEPTTLGAEMRLVVEKSTFTEEAEAWFDFITKVAHEETMQFARLKEMARAAGVPRVSRKTAKCADFELYGWRLDKFFELAKDDDVDMKIAGQEKLQDIDCIEEKPELTMQIRRCSIGDDGEFHGIAVDCKMPEFYIGVDAAYFLTDDALCKTDMRVIKQIEPLYDRRTENGLHFQIGRNQLTDFYYSILPKLKEYFTVTEENGEEIHSYLPPEEKFIFYLDVKDGEICCRVTVLCGEEECSLIELTSSDMGKARYERFRVEEREQEVCFYIRRFFPDIEWEDDLFVSDREENMIEAIKHAEETFARFGEVCSTQAFKNLRVIDRLQAQVNLSVSDGELVLELAPKDISCKDLLEAFQERFFHEKYDQLNNGSLINTEGETFRAVKDLVDAVRPSAKEFNSGKIKLPLYRAPYLDGLFEEREGLWVRKDAAFSQIAESFRTAGDADFALPEDLNAALEARQKVGFSRLKTLERLQFGGVLGVLMEDTELGRTLQTIAFLLSVKEKGAVSLLILPSSQVINQWKAELAKYAPTLKVQFVTGSPKERKEMLKEYEKYDISVTSYDFLKQDAALYLEKQFTYVVLDDAQTVKTPSSALAKTLKQLGAQMRIALADPSIEDRLGTLWNVFDFLMPGFLFDYAFFKEEFETRIVRQGDGEKADLLKKMTDSFILR